MRELKFTNKLLLVLLNEKKDMKIKENEKGDKY